MADFAVSHEVLDRPLPDIEVTSLAQDRLALVCSDEHPLAGRRQVQLRDLVDGPFVDFPADWTTRRLVDRAFASAGLDRRHTIAVNDIATSLALVARGIGVTVLPEAVRAQTTERVAFRALARRLDWDFSVARRADGAAGPAARELLRRILSKSEQQSEAVEIEAARSR